MRRRILRLGLAIVLLVAMAFGAVLVVGDIELHRLRDRLAAELAAVTGREVRIEGPMRLELALAPRLDVRGLHLGNADWAAEPDMLVAGRVTLQVALLPLLHGEFRLQSVTLHEVSALVERNAAGSLNWQLGVAEDRSAPTSGDESASASDTYSLAADHVRIEQLRLHYRDAVGLDLDLELTLDELTLAAPARDGPLVAGARGRLAGRPLQVSARAGSLQAVLDGRRTPLELLLAVGRVRLRGDGELPALGEYLALDATLEAPDLASVLDVAAGVVPALAQVRLPDVAPLAVSARLIGERGALRLDELAVAAGGSRLQGEFAWSWAGRQRIDARLAGAGLDLAAFAAASDAAPRRRLFGEEALPWHALQAMDADVALDIERVRLGGLLLAPARVRLTLANGRATLTPDLGVAGGGVSGEFAADADARSLRARVTGSDIVLGQLLAGMDADKGLTGAPTTVQASFAAVGDSPHALAAGADGSLLMVVGRGRLPAGALGWLGGDIALTLSGEFGSGGDDMQLECGVVNFDLTDGVLGREAGIGLRFDRMNVVGGGSIDLGTEALDLRLVPETREGVGLSAGSALAGLVALRGSLMQPSVEVSSEGLAKAGAKVGAAFVTGGLSLLASAIYERVAAEDDVCKAVLAAEGEASTPAAAKPSIRRRRHDE